MDDALRVTLAANAGVLLTYRGTTLLIDAIYGGEGHPFSCLPPQLHQAMLAGEGAFGRVDYLLFTHAHPDHFSPEMTLDYLRHRPVKGVFLPDTRSVRESGLADYLRDSATPAVFLSAATDRAAFRIEEGITVRAFHTLHLDKLYQHVHHFCYLLSFGDKDVLFCADIDYTQESLSQLRGRPLRAAFVNPLFFAELRRRRFFHGALNAQTLCIYHVPFSDDDAMGMRPRLANDIVCFDPAQDVAVLSEPLQELTL